MKSTRLTLVLLSILGALTSLLLAYFAARPIDSDPKFHRKMETLAALELYGKNMDLWIGEHGRVPTAQEGLNVLGLYQNPVVDGWGRSLTFRPSTKSGGTWFMLYSVGPNGQDEEGAGDDILYAAD